MERRRRALGLIKPGENPEKNPIKSSRQSSTSGGSSKFKSDEKSITRDKATRKNHSTGSVTPKQKTTISHCNVTSTPESPCSPLQSPGNQMIFLGTLASPEIEVSWDWSCSQVPKDMLPPKKKKRIKDVKSQISVLHTIDMCPRPRPALQQQISEEENRQRLEYYKNILSLKPLECNSEVSSDSTNNNLEPGSSEVTKSFATPKRPTTRLSSASKKKDDSLFDDSANEFMFECSQAIEEKLRNGEVDMGPIVDIKISQAKRAHSPGSTNLNKKACHGRVNLFPENTCSKDECSEVNVGNRDHYEAKLLQKPIMTNNNTLKTNHVSEISPQNCYKQVEGALNDCVVSEPAENKCVNQTSFDVDKNEANSMTTRLSANCSTRPVIKSDVRNLERRPFLAKQTQSAGNPSSINHMKTSQNVYTEMAQKSVPIVNDNNVKTFCKTLNKQFGKLENQNTYVMRNQLGVRGRENIAIDAVKQIQSTNLQEKSNTADIKALLDDGFDLELSCLDVDSLCQSTENNQPQTNSAPKICTRQEIEAKRLAALQKLRMKNKR